MIRVRYNNDPLQECTIRPTPFVQINLQKLKNKEGNFGTTYTIVLTGTLMPSRGTPYAIDPLTDLPYPDFGNNPLGGAGPNGIGPYGAFDNIGISARAKPPRQQSADLRPAASLLSKQRALRALFGQDGQTLIITDIIDNAPATVWCNPRVISVDFTEGVYVNRCEYTITLEADLLMRGYTDENAIVDNEGVVASGVNGYGESVSISQLLDETDLDGKFIEDYSEDWSLEAGEGDLGATPENPISYRVSHSLSATGKTFYNQDGVIQKPAWQQAKDFVLERLGANDPANDYPSYPNIAGVVGSGTVNLANAYGGYNLVRTEQINVAAGTYAVSENWILVSGAGATETYNLSTSTSTSDPFVSVKLDGTIKGMRENAPNEEPVKTQYEQALEKWYTVSNSGKFGITSDVYKRCDNLVAVTLNSQPLSTSVSTNEFNGEITYSVDFNNRPTNIISGVLTETITINDTYPGDVFATIPVIGRETGPVLQYVGGRTEYKRDISLSLVMDYTKIPYGSGRNPLLLKKPSIVEPTATQISQLLEELSPQGEPGIRKYFVTPPTENWSPKDGTYNFNVSFTYELDK
jgi:hypothetical protein